MPTVALPPQSPTRPAGPEGIAHLEVARVLSGRPDLEAGDGAAAGGLDAVAGLYQRLGTVADAAAATVPDTRLLEVADLWQQAGQPAEALSWYRRAARRGEADQAVTFARCLGRRPLPAALPAALEDDRLLAEAMLRSASLIPEDWGRLRFTPLSGTRNRLYRIDDPVSGESFVLRLERTLPASPWWRYGREWLHLRQAHALGVAPEPLYIGLADGVLLTRLVPGEGLTRKSFRDPEVITRVAEGFGRLHGAPPLSGLRDMFAAVRRREAVLGRDGGPPDLPRWRERFWEWRALLDENGVPLANGHNDPIPGNLFDLTDRVVLIDWEFAGPTDPDFDLGYVMAAVRRGAGFDRQWMTACHGQPDHPRAARAAIYRALLHYLWLLKALSALRGGRSAPDWLRRAERSLAFLRGTVPTPAFQQQLEQVRAYRWRADPEGQTNLGNDRE